MDVIGKSMMNKIKYYLKRIPNIPKTFLMNFYYLPLKQAIHFPIFVASNIKIKSLGDRNALKLNCYHHGSINLGISHGPYNINIGVKGCWDISRGACIYFEGTCSLAAGIKMDIGSGAKVFVGDGVSMNTACLVVARKQVRFGKDMMAGWNCSFMDTDHHIIFTEYEEVCNYPCEIVIGDHVWIGANSTILKGSNIGDNSIIALGTVISADYGERENVIIAGNPGRIVKESRNWSRKGF